MHDTVYTDAARFKQLSVRIMEAGFTSFPNRTVIDRLVATDVGLRAWIRQYHRPSQFMRDAKLFFYRERKRHQARRHVT